jgi:hypothetical protein
MSKAFGSHTTCLRIALIALSIQGVTPDSDDLTSFSLSRILLSILADSICPIDDSVPLGDETHDEKPDEVCMPASAGVRLPLRCRVGTLRIRGLIPALADERTRRPDHLRPPSSPGGSVQRGEMILSLCRLTC